MVEYIALIAGILGPFQLGRDLKAYLRTRSADGEGRWPVYKGWRAWLFPLGDVVGIIYVIGIIGISIAQITG